MCVIAASVTDQPVQTQIYARLYRAHAVMRR